MDEYGSARMSKHAYCFCFMTSKRSRTNTKSLKHLASGHSIRFGHVWNAIESYQIRDHFWFFFMIIKSCCMHHQYQLLFSLIVPKLWFIISLRSRDIVLYTTIASAHSRILWFISFSHKLTLASYNIIYRSTYTWIKRTFSVES